MFLPELMLKNAHQNVIMILVILVQHVPLHAFTLEAELLIRMNGAFVKRKDIQFDPMQIGNAEAVVQHK